MKIRRTNAPKCMVGKGPVWDVREQALYLVDIVGKLVHRYDPGSGRTIDPALLGRPTEECGGETWVIEGRGARGLPEPRYAG